VDRLQKYRYNSSDNYQFLIWIFLISEIVKDWNRKWDIAVTCYLSARSAVLQLFYCRIFFCYFRIWIFQNGDASEFEWSSLFCTLFERSFWWTHSFANEVTEDQILDIYCLGGCGKDGFMGLCRLQFLCISGKLSDLQFSFSSSAFYTNAEFWKYW
jgi:hypothetical protein